MASTLAPIRYHHTRDMRLLILATERGSPLRKEAVSSVVDAAYAV